MSIKRTKYRVGPFERGHIHADMNDPGAFAAAVEIVKANSPAGRIATWRPHAERLGIAGDLLDAAQALIDGNGNVANIERFDRLLSQAESAIERAQNESLDVYGLAGSRARHNEQLRQNVAVLSAEKRRESQVINAVLIAWDDEIASEHKRLNQTRRAQKILQDHREQLPVGIADLKPDSLAKRIRSARKK